MGGQMVSAIQITTASAICAVLDMLVDGRLADAGFVCQEEIGLGEFLANRFGAAYASAETASLAEAARPKLAAIA
jgi:saccharopine dehydrogenase-like NADP-dependent oxidoreductase